MNPFITESKQIGLFVTAGFPSLDSTAGWIKTVQNKNFDFIEIGMPFSDPLADGPVIQKSSEIALKNGMNMSLLFDQIGAVKSEIQLPVVLMGYLNPVLQYGLDKFLSKCKETGIKHVILPDMSVELFERFYLSSFEKYGISNCFLITTQTPEHILKKVKNYSANSFVYLVSSNSTTGEKGEFVLTNQSKINEIKTLFGKIPLFIGFGIRNSKDIEIVNKLADGAIIGSAFIKAIEAGQSETFLNDLKP